MAKQVMVRYKNLHGNTNTLKRCEVLAESNGKMKIKCSDEREARMVEASETISVESVYGQANPGRRSSTVSSALPASPHCLANRSL